MILRNPLVLLLFNSDPFSFLPSLASVLQAEWLQDQSDALRGRVFFFFSSSDDLFFPPKCWSPFATLLAESYYCLGVLSAQKKDKEQMVRAVEMGLIVECCMKDKSVLIPFKRLLWNTFDIPSCFPDMSDTSVFFFLFQLFLDLPDILPPLTFTSSLVCSLHSCPFPLSTNLPLTFILRDIVPSLFTQLVGLFLLLHSRAENTLLPSSSHRQSLFFKPRSLRTVLFFPPHFNPSPSVTG